LNVYESVHSLWDNLHEHVVLALESNSFTDPEGLLYWPLAIVYLAIGAFVLSRRPDADASVRGSFRALFPRSIYGHRSSAMDLKVWLIEMFATRTGRLTYALGGALLTAGFIESMWAGVLGEPASKAEVSWGTGCFYALVVLVAVDFAEFFWHYLTHKVGWLWELHKAHHSAEVLNPITDSRFHPVDFLGSALFEMSALAVVEGTFMYYFDGSIVTWTIFSITAIAAFLGVTNIFFHSHIWISFGYAGNHILISPAQHQIHHSVLPQHRDKNMGAIFAFWDYFFGTLYVPQDRETFPVGLADGEGNPHTTLRKFYVDPLVNSVRHLARSIRGQRDTVGESSAER
jgi:sterol desaturase/sphingolipid hydroxylase (fatty acid hydroxylase superfamily)